MKIHSGFKTKDKRQNVIWSQKKGTLFIASFSFDILWYWLWCRKNHQVKGYPVDIFNDITMPLILYDMTA